MMTYPTVIGRGNFRSATFPEILSPPHKTKQVPTAAYTSNVATAPGIGVTVTFNVSKQKSNLMSTLNSPPIWKPSVMGMKPPITMKKSRLKNTTDLENAGSPAAMQKSGASANSEHTSRRKRCVDMSSSTRPRAARCVSRRDLGGVALVPFFSRPLPSLSDWNNAPNVPCSVSKRHP